MASLITEIKRRHLELVPMCEHAGTSHACAGTQLVCLTAEERDVLVAGNELFGSEAFRDARAERARQDLAHVGPAHDDTHTVRDWLDFIEQQAMKARLEEPDDEGQPNAAVRTRFINIAALAIAAVESLDRRSGQVS